MVKKRKLTGNYYLKRRFFGGYDLMVEVIIRMQSEDDFSFGPEFNKYVKAEPEDFIKLKINVM